MESHDTCPSVLISDLPASEDAFGSHDRLATTLAELIRSAETGKNIALEGYWGSGKSTVVRLLEQKLRADRTTTVAIFDAWAHQDDPLRRTFLEKLISSLSGALANPKDWEKRRSKLAGRLREERRTETPQLTSWGKFIAFSLLVVPIGLAMATVNLLVDIDLWIRVVLVAAGLAITASPVLMVASRFALRAIGMEPKAWKAESIGDVLSTHATTVIQAETHETPDPTSVEFEQIFSDLMSDALSASDSRLIIILDNLDRVDAADALKVWSTLQTFLHQSEHANPPWLKRLWIIVPYDRGGIRRLWEPAENKADAGAAGPVAASFLDKTFQARFQVPPLVLSDWRTYLSKLLTEALPAHDAASFRDVHRVFAHHNSPNASPTPRTLKLFANEVSSLHLLWDHEIPLSQLAYYSLLVRDGVRIPDSLLGGQVPDEALVRLLGPDARDNLAALHFGRPPHVARQLILEGPIEDALAKGDSTRLKELEEKNGEGFWAVLDNAASEDRLRWDRAQRVASSALALNESGLLANARSECSNILNELKTAAMVITSWAPLDDATAQGIAAMLALSSGDSSIRGRLAKTLSSSPIAAAEERGASAGAWATSIASILQHIQEEGNETSETFKITVPCDAAQWIEFAPPFLAADVDGLLRGYIRPKATGKDIVAALSAAATSGSFSSDLLLAQTLTNATLRVAEWQPLIDVIHARLQAQNSVPGPELVALLESLANLPTAREYADIRLKDLCATGHLFHHLQQQQSDNEAVSWCMFSMLRTFPFGQPPAEVGSSNQGFSLWNQLASNPTTRPEISEGLVAILSDLGESRLLLELVAPNSPAKPFAIHCLKLIAVNDGRLEFFTPEVVFEYWGTLDGELSREETDVFLADMITKTSLLDEIQKSDFDLDLVSLYGQLALAGALSNAGFSSWCLESLRQIEQGEWQKELSDEGYLLELLLSLLESGAILSWGNLAFRDALLQHATGLIGEAKKPTEFESDWPQLLASLSEDHRISFRRDLYREVEKANGQIGDAFFDIYGNELADEKTLSGTQDTPHRLLTPILREGSGRALQWLVNTVRDRQPLFKKGFDRAAVTHFRERISEIISDSEGRDAKKLASVQEIADILGVKPTLPPPPEPEPSASQ